MMELPSSAWSLSSPAEENRDFLVRFWLAAPSDQLQALWASSIGEASRRLISQLQPATVFLPEQVQSREAINQRLMLHGLQHPLAPQLLLAVFHYSPPGLIQVANASQQLPAWLAAAYQELYVSSQLPDSQPPSEPDCSHQFMASPPDFGAFPESLEDLVRNRVQLNRLLGLSNLYYVDPEDQEITHELVNLRRQLADLIYRSPESGLEAIWATDFGDRYWSLVRSGIQKEPLLPEDQVRKERCTKALTPASGGGFGIPGSINAFLVAMLYYEPGSMYVDGAEQKLPTWLFQHYHQIFVQPLDGFKA